MRSGEDTEEVETMKTIETSPTKNEYGAIGIGAMIVFIALILVAAVASAVIIQTAEKLQQNAQQTGSDTENEIGSKIVILSGTISATDNIILTFELGAGSSNVAETAVSWLVTCDKGAVLTMDSGDFSGATNLGGAGAPATFVAGTAYELPISVDDCTLTTSTNYNLDIAVTNGGTTYETISTGLSVAVGETVI